MTKNDSERLEDTNGGANEQSARQLVLQAGGELDPAANALLDLVDGTYSKFQPPPNVIIDALGATDGAVALYLYGSTDHEMYLRIRGDEAISRSRHPTGAWKETAAPTVYGSVWLEDWMESIHRAELKRLDETPFDDWEQEVLHP